MKSEIFAHKERIFSHEYKHYSFIDDRILQEEENLIETLQEKVKKRKKHKKIVAASPLAIDITQFFAFKKKYFFFIIFGRISSETSLIEQLSGGYCAWLILGYCMLNNSLILPWMMFIDADKFLRQAWRHIFLNMVLIPFILYEKRTASEEKKELYKLKNIFKTESLKNAFLVAFSKALWLIVIMTSYQYTTVAHTLILGNLMNFFLSINRFFSNSYHFLEPGGQIFILVGIFLIIKDEILMDTSNIDQQYRMISFADYNWHLRVIVDIIALLISFVMAMFSQYTGNLNKDYPSYLGVTIVNFMIAALMFGAALLFHGATLDADEDFGVFGLFCSENFSTFFQLSFFIGFGMLWSYTMISNLFPEPLIPTLSALFEPMISLMIMDFAGLQQLPSGFTVMGYIFIIPGTFLILIGQSTYQKLQKAEEKEIEKKLKELIEFSKHRKNSNQNELNSPLFAQKAEITSSGFHKEYSDVKSFHDSENEHQFYQQPKPLSLKHILSEKDKKSTKKLLKSYDK